MLAYDVLGNTTLGSFSTFQVYIGTPASFSFETENGTLTVNSDPSVFTYEGVDGEVTYIYITNPSEFSFEGVDTNITTIGQTSSFDFKTEQGEITITGKPALYKYEGVDGEPIYVYVADPSEFSFEGVDTNIKITSQPSSYTFETEDGVLTIPTSPSSFSFEAPLGLVNLSTLPSEFSFEGVDGVSSATGTVNVITSIPVFEFQGVDGTPNYIVNVNEIPDLVVNRTGSTVTIDVRNLRDRNINIYKANLDGSNKGNFSLLETTGSFPYEDTVTGEVKYKTAFVFSGSIGGSTIEETGPHSMSRYAKDE